MLRRVTLSLLALLFLSGDSTVAQETPSLPTKAGAESDRAPTDALLTTIQTDVPLSSLRVMVKPLTKAELQVEADGWLQLLRAKARQIAVIRLGVRKANEAVSTEDEAKAHAVLQNVEQAKANAEATVEQTTEQITEAAQGNLGIEQSDTPSGEGESAPSELEPGPESGASVADVSSEMKNELLEDIVALQDERAALYDRLTIVLDSLEEKGGDVTEYRHYADAVTRVALETSDVQAAWSAITGWLASEEGGQRWGWNLLKFLVVLITAYLAARFIATVINWFLERRVKLSQLAERLISNTIRNVLLIVGFAVALTTLEIEVTPLLAAIGATGLVVGLALQNSLSNVASGMMILINRPFDIGDVVTAGGVTGTVNQMNLVSTTFRTFDNQTIYVPNNEIWNNIITNITANPTRRVDLEFGIGYDDDFDEAERIIREVVDDHELVLSDPAPEVVTHALGDSSVNIICRPWANTSDWWRVKTEVTREVKRRLDAANISIPYPQRHVHVYHGPPTDDPDANSENP